MTPHALRLVLPAVPLAAETCKPWLTADPVPVPPASLPEARARRDDLAHLLGRERVAAADFLLALSDFDRRRGWEALGHASLFAFLHRELRLSKGAAYLRFTAARLLPRFPEVEAALRDGRLCLSAVGELSRVLTPENQAEVLPRFFGCSSRVAREVAAALVPPAAQPRREVVTSLASPQARPAVPGQGVAAASVAEAAPAEVRAHELLPVLPRAAPPPTAVEASPVARPVDRPQADPLDADLRRLHLTVSKRLLDKVAAARDALSHKLPGASTDQVLEAALDLLLERHAARHALVRRPRKAKPAQEPAPEAADPEGTESPEPARPVDEGPGSCALPAPPPRSRAIPAAVEREVRLRDQGRCQYPLDAGGVCGSTHRTELDHVIPVALGGVAAVEGLRLACAFHNQLAARRVLGEVAAAARGRRPKRRG